MNNTSSKGKAALFLASDDSGFVTVSNCSVMAAEGKSDREPLCCLAT